MSGPVQSPARSEDPPVGKVVAYVTRGDRLLVFRQPRFPEAGLQVPSGTIEPGEAPERAVMRELWEETGLRGFGPPLLLGTQVFDMRPHGRDERHFRHFFHLPLLGEAPERWSHLETCGGTEPGVEFDLFWLAYGNCSPALIAGRAALLERLREVTALR